MTTKGKKRWRRRLGTVAGALVILALATTVVLRVRFHGPPLASTITGILNQDIRGLVRVQSVEWPLGSLPAALVGGWLPVTVHGVEVYDDGGSGGVGVVDDADRELLLKVDLATAQVDLHALMRGNHDLVVKDLVVPNGGYVLIKEVYGAPAAGEPATSDISLLTVFLNKRKPSFGAGMTATTVPIFDLLDYSFEEVCVELQFVGFRMVVEGARGSGYLYSDMSDPLSEKLYYALAPTAARGIVRAGIPAIVEAGVGKRSAEQVAEGCLPLVRDHAPIPPQDSQYIYDIPVHDIQVHRLAQLPTGWPRDAIAHDVTWNITAQTDEGGQVEVEGGLLDYWVGDYGGRYEIDLTVHNAGPLVQRLSEGVLRGDELRVDGRVDGSALAPRVTLHASGMYVSLPLGEEVPPLDLHLGRTTAVLDLVTEAGFIHSTEARGAGGVVSLAAAFSIDPFQFDLELDIREPIVLSPYLPRELQKVAGDRLRGYLRIEGDGERQRFEPLDLWLGRARVSGALFKDERDRFHTRALRGNIGRTEVNTRGFVDLVEGSFDLRLALSSRDVAWWLRYLDAPPMATGLDGTVQLTGNMADPRACASLQVSGVPIIDQVKTWLGYRGEVLSVDVNKAPDADTACARARRGEAEARPVLGGSLWASGRMRMGPRMEVLSMKAQADALELARVPELDGIVGGTLSATATARGPIQRLDAQADVALDRLTIAGDGYRVTTSGADQETGRTSATCEDRICFRMRPDGTKQLAFALTRDGGGELGVRAALDARSSLSGEITLKELPMDRLDALQAEREALIGGVVTAALTLGGTLEAPTVAGKLGWKGGWYDSAFLGHSDFQIRQIGPGLVAIEGTLLQGDLRVTAEVHTRAPYKARLHLAARRLELDRFAPALAREMNARAWVSGEIDIETTLAPAAGSTPQISMRLTEAEVMVDNKDSRGRPAPIRLRNAPETPIVAHFDGAQARLLQAVTLVGPAGAAFSVDGRGSAGELAVTLQGIIDLRLLEPYVREHIDAVSGKVKVAAAIKGTLASPRVEIDLELAETVAVRPARQDAEVSLVKGGRITITNDQIVTTGTRLVVEDPLTGQMATLLILGNVGLRDFVPTQWALQMDGELAGKMLLVAAPEVFSQASGTAKLWVSVAGSSEDPIIDVELSLATAQPLSFTPRGLGREIRFTAGQIELSESSVLLRRVAGWIGDEGRITDVSGEISLKNWQPARVDVTLSADNLPFRIPQTLDLTVNINALEVAGSMDGGMRIGGAVEVVDGRYIRKFNLITDVLSPERSTSTGQPFYESVPLLANARLDLILDVRGFAVQNNLATIQMSGDIEVAGTPREPRFNGKVQVDQGEFKLPGARAKFTRTQGAVTFSESKEFPTQTPELNVQSEGDYRDSSGQYHLITLNIEGPLSRPKWDLYTSSGLNKGQTVTMLFSGRTPAELRKSLGDEAPGVNPGRIDSSTSTSENVADQLLKDIAGDFISLLVEDTLRNLTTLDVARIEIGTGSIGFYGEKELADNVRVRGNFEQTGSGRTLDVRGEVQVTDRASLEAGYLNKNYEETVPIEDVNDRRFRVVWRRYFFWP